MLSNQFYPKKLTNQFTLQYVMKTDLYCIKTTAVYPSHLLGSGSPVILEMDESETQAFPMLKKIEAISMLRVPDIDLPNPQPVTRNP